MINTFNLNFMDNVSSQVNENTLAVEQKCEDHYLLFSNLWSSRPEYAIRSHWES